MNSGPESDVSPPPSREVNDQLNAFFTPLLTRFVQWRQRTVTARSPVDVAGLVSPGNESAPRDIGLLNGAERQLRDWPYFLHTFSRDAAWDIPVGAYGSTWSHQLGAIAEGLRHDWDVFVDQDDQVRVALNTLDRNLIYTGTFWGSTYASREPEWWISAPGQTVREGITSVGQSIALLTLDSVDGYSSGFDLAHDLVALGLLDRFALQLPLNVQQPMIACRKVLPGPVLARTPEGGLDFSHTVATFLNEQSAHYRAAMLGRSDDARVADGAAGAGNGCPVAHSINNKASGITQIYGLYEWLILQLTKPPGRQD